MKANPLVALTELGQSVWMDFIRRGTIVSGELQRAVDQDAVRGITSNPSLFEKAIAGSREYDEAVRALALEGLGPEAMYERLTTEDIRLAADVLRPTWDRLHRGDGYVSLEVSPHLAHDAAGTVAEARRLWAEVARPNAMIKVPATKEGLAAIEQLTAEGVNVNITLLFGLPRYREVADAYLSGLESRLDRHLPVDGISSVASFFLSRIDVLVDAQLERIQGPHEQVALALRGEVAIASAKIAYQLYREIFGGERFRRLAEKGARPQRLLWASTSAKNPAYSDVKYVEPLIGPDTINTLPPETLAAYRDHGRPGARLSQGVEEARQVLARLAEVGIDLDQATQRLEDEGVRKFIQPYDKLLETLERRSAQAKSEPVDRETLSVRGYGKAIEARLEQFERDRLIPRIWRKEPGVWKSDAASRKSIAAGLGWLHVAEKVEASLGDLDAFVSEVKAAGFREVVLLGMGGSSLAPLVFARTFPAAPGLRLSVLDTVDPASVLELERRLSLEQTLFIVASKSGTTAEPNALGDYFFDRISALRGDDAGGHFVAITDPGTPLAALASERGFRRVFLNFPDIGGRYSALSYFGLVPAALHGVDVREVVARALRMKLACDPCMSPRNNPGAQLGALLGELALAGRDKVTFLMPPRLAPLGLWLEQLLAESTGKEGKGLLPVSGEDIGDPSVYGDDRLLVRFRLLGEPDAEMERGVSALRATQPVVTLELADALDLGQEFFRWEMATAVAGAVLGIDPFDQPNVEESKANTNRLLERVRTGGELPEEPLLASEGPLRFRGSGQAANAAALVRDFLSGAKAHGYVSLQAYVPESEANDAALESLRLALRDGLRTATTVGYGPRFLHSTGQFHKGGPNTGLFLQLVGRGTEDVPVPGRPYTFGTFKRAQAMGDLEALRRHGRRVLPVELGEDVPAALGALRRLVEAALGRGR